jgi:hypothetical protein
VNYRGADGDWHAIDDSLVASPAAGYALENASDRYRVAFPDDLAAKPVEVSQGGDSLGFRLLGAEGHATASGPIARYAGALPGVTTVYTASPDGVKEDLKLANADAPSSYDYAVSLSDGLDVRENTSGGVDVVDASGDVQFSFEAPFAYDQAGARLDSGSQLSLNVVRDGDQPRLRLAIDAAWLKAADREFPIVIDPSVSLGDNQDCYIAGGSGANTSYCGGSNLKVGWDGTQAYRALLRFDLSGIPANSAIAGAHLMAYLNSHTTTNQTGVSAYQVTRPWTSGATWNKYDGTNAWTSAGGDIQAPATYTNPSAWGWPSTGTWYEWGTSNLVQQWHDGAAPNYGVLLKEPVENITNVMSYTSGTPSTSFAPYLQVDWEPKFMGDQSWYPMVGQTPLGDGQGLAVNADGGNLVAHSTDLHIAGVGLPFTVGRTYNNLSPEMNSWGYGWQINGGFDMWLDQHDDAQTFFDPTGTPFRFTRNTDGSYTAPPGIDATLKTNADGTNTITYNKSRLQLNFDDDGDLLTSIKDRNGNTLSYTYGGAGVSWIPSSVTDSQGRTTTFGYDTTSWSPRINLITDSSGRSVSYTYYANGGPLKTFTDGAGKTTTYSYNSDTFSDSKWIFSLSCVISR